MPTYILLFGAPGAGKGTQSAILKAEYGIPHVASGDLFRHHLSENTPLGQLAKGFMDRGELVPDDVTVEMVRGRLHEADAANGACGCCALQSAFTSQGDLLVLYRASIAVVHRDEHLLRIPAAGPVTDLKLDDWERPGCPMTTAAILPGLDRTLLAWESKGEIRWAPLTPKQTAPDKLTSAGTPAASKYHRAIGKPLDLGVLFTAIAGMLNLIAVIDAGFPTRRRLP